jgi:hypothetical protein
MRRALLAVALCLLYAAPAVAQAGIPTSYTLRIYTDGTPLVQALTVAMSQVSCNLASSPGTGTEPAENPTLWIWDDPVNAGKLCAFNDSARMSALPNGNYHGTATAENADGSSAETASVPFTRRRLNPPGVPTGLRVIK